MFEVSNTDVKWDASFDGFVPNLDDRLVALPENAEGSISELIALLSDPDRFVIAHVLLTRITGVDYSAWPKWNGLVLDLDAEGRATVEPDQRHALARRWERWYTASPRTRTLFASNT
jgi:hypothetical protein